MPAAAWSAWKNEGRRRNNFGFLPWNRSGSAGCWRGGLMLPIGMRLGPYQIVAPLGRGGMGEVYRAKDLRLGREVAVKVLPERFAQDPNLLARFEREARAVAGLAHPNILVLHVFGHEQGL